MKHLLSLLTACLLSLSAQAQQTWNFVDLSESIPLIKADETNWNVDKHKTDAPDVPVQWSNKNAFTEWSTLKANGEEIPATKGLMFIGAQKKLILSIIKNDKNYFIGCTDAMNVYSISLSAADEKRIAQTTICKPSGNDKFYTIDGKLVKPTHKGIIIAKGKKYANK